MAPWGTHLQEKARPVALPVKIAKGEALPPVLHNKFLKNFMGKFVDILTYNLIKQKKILIYHNVKPRKSLACHQAFA